MGIVLCCCRCPFRPFSADISGHYQWTRCDLDSPALWSRVCVFHQTATCRTGTRQVKQEMCVFLLIEITKWWTPQTTSYCPKYNLLWVSHRTGNDAHWIFEAWNYGMWRTQLQHLHVLSWYNPIWIWCIYDWRQCWLLHVLGSENIKLNVYSFSNLTLNNVTCYRTMTRKALIRCHPCVYSVRPTVGLFRIDQTIQCFQCNTFCFFSSTVPPTIAGFEDQSCLLLAFCFAWRVE